MKELTIEQKNQRYDEALKAAIAAHKDEDRHLKATLERIFPELKEFEDEKIRKALIDIVNARCELYKGITKEMFLAWLEKQGEQKEDATRYKITEHLKKLILDQSQRGAHMLDYEGRIEEEVDFVISIAKKELKNEKQSEWSEEDEQMRKNAVDFMKHPDLIKTIPNLAKITTDWLESLKDKYTWKPSI